MAILQVNQPRQRQQQIEQPQQSTLEKGLNRLIQGLTVAKQGYGIATDLSRIEQLKAQTAALPSPEEASQQRQLEQTRLGQQAETERATTELRQAQTQRTISETPTQRQLDLGLQKKQLEIEESQARLDKLQNKIADPKVTVNLRKEWKADPTTKATQIGKVSIDKIRSATKGPPTAIKDHSLVFGYMKTLDPGSVVKEGEFTTVEKAGGIIDRFTVGLFNKTRTGQMLTPEQRENIINTSNELWQQQVNAQQQLNSEYRRLANEQGLPPNQVVLDLGLEEIQQPQQQTQQQFGEGEIKAVMEATGGSREDAIIRLKTVTGG